MATVVRARLRRGVAALASSVAATVRRRDVHASRLGPRACPGTPAERSAAARDTMPSVWATSRPLRGSGSTPILGRRWLTGRPTACARPGGRSRAPARSTFRPSRSPQVRSAESSWSAPMTAPPRRSQPRRPRAAAPGRSDGARRHPARDHRPVRRLHLRDARRPSDAHRPRHLAAPWSTGRAGRSGPGAHRYRRRFGRTFSTEFHGISPGTTSAVQSCGEVACRTRLVTPPAGRTRVARRARSRHPRRARRRHAGDLRGMPRLPLPDRLDRPRDRPPDACSRCHAGFATLVVATPDGPGSCTRSRPVRVAASLGPSRRGEAVDLGRSPDDRRLAATRCPPARRSGCLPAGSPSPPTAGCLLDRPVRPRHSSAISPTERPSRSARHTMNATRRLHPDAG